MSEADGATWANRGVPLIAFAMALAFASGVVDIASFIRLGTVFASVMTGNLVLLGLASERTSGQLAAHSGIAIAIYVAGVALGARICRGPQKQDVVWPRSVTTTFVVELLALAVFTVGWELSSGQPSAAEQLWILPFAALSMGLQSEAVRNVRAPLSTTYLTGTLTEAVASIVTRRRVSGVSLAVIGATAAGAAAGGGVLVADPSVLPALPLLAVAGVVAAVTTVGPRSSSQA